MIDWLYTLPDTTILVVGAIVLALVIVLLPSVSSRLPGMTPSNDNTDFVLRMQATLFTMTSLVLAFTLVEAESNYRKVDALISTEASQLNRFDRLLTRYGDTAPAALRPHLLAYAESIIRDEWPAMLKGTSSEKTRTAFIPISRGLLAIEPHSPREATIYAELLRSFDALAETRDARLATVSVALPTAYWQVVLFAVLMLLFISSTIGRTPFRATVLAAQMAVLGAFMGFVFIMDQPFKGQTAVGPDQIVQATATIRNRTN
ncbi:MAG: hypothetical protein U1E60_12245 [Reyranellaceae bacterium]